MFGGESILEYKHRLDTMNNWAKLQTNIHEATNHQKEQDSKSVNVQSDIHLLQAFDHPVHVRAVCHSKTQHNCATIVALYKSGHTEVNVWLHSPEQCYPKPMTFVLKEDIRKMIFLDNLKLFAAYCKNMTIRMFTDYQYGFREVSTNRCGQTLLCIVYSEEANELFGGGIGCVLHWKVAALSGALTQLEPCDINFSENELIQGMTINDDNQMLVIHTLFNVYIWDFALQVHIHTFEICHDPGLTCAFVYPPDSLMITASEGGFLQVWDWSGPLYLKQDMTGHDCQITAMLTHPTEPLLITSSLDGTICVWRLDLFELQQKIEVGAPVLGMTFVDTDVIVYWSASTIKMFHLNLFFQVITVINAEISDVFSSSSFHCTNRLVVTASNGSVRILSPVSGLTLTIVYALSSEKLPTQTVYERTEDQLYLLIDGAVQVFDCHTNPSHIQFKLELPSEKDQILCMAHVVTKGGKKCCASKSFIFAGLADGHICLLYAKTELMSKSVMAHDGPVCILDAAYHSAHSKSYTPTLVSCGKDFIIKIWHIVLVENRHGMISLRLTYSMRVLFDLLHLRMMNSVICYSDASKIGKVHMYEVDKGELSHVATEDHTAMINGIACSESLGLFASSADDGIIKVWNLKSVMIREMVFDSSLRGVSFANERGDIVAGMHGLVVIVPAPNYLPLARLDKVQDKKLEDVCDEFPLPFEHELELCVYLDKVTTYPVDLAERRISQFWEERDREEGDILKEAREEEEVEPEEQCLAVIPEIEYQIELEPLREGNVDIKSTTSRRTSQSVKMAEDVYTFTVLSVNTTEEKARKDVALAEKQINFASNTDASTQDEPPAVVGPITVTNVTSSTAELHWQTTTDSDLFYAIAVRRKCANAKYRCIGFVKVPPVKVVDMLYNQSYSVQVFARNKTGSSLPLTSPMIYPHKKKRRTTMTAAEAKKSLEQRKAEEGMRREMESKRREEEIQEQARRKEERRRKHIIAPDGHIPNSVVRSNIGYIPVSDPIMNRALEYMAFLEQMERADALWKFFRKRNRLSWKDKLTWQGSRWVELGEEAMADEQLSPERIRRSRLGMSLTPEVELRIVSPSASFRASSPLPQIPEGATEPTSRTPTTQMEADSRGAEMTKGIDEAAAAVVPDVFKGILGETWFPFSQIPPMSELITLFLDLLDTTDPDTMHKQICEYLTEMYGQFGYTEATLQNIVNKLVEQLGHHQPVIRQTSLATLLNLGLRKTDIVSKIVPMLSCTNYSRRRAATLALRELTDVCNEGYLTGLRNHITMLKAMERNTVHGRSRMDSTHRVPDISPSFEPRFPHMSHSLSRGVLMDAAWDQPLSGISSKVGESSENVDRSVEDMKGDAVEEEGNNAQVVSEAQLQSPELSNEQLNSDDLGRVQLWKAPIVTTGEDELDEPDEQMSAADRRNADWMLSADRKMRTDRGKRRSSKDNGNPKPRPSSRKARKKSLENKKSQYAKRRSEDRGTPSVSDHGTPCQTDHDRDDREITPTLVQVDYGTNDLSSKSSEEFVEKMPKTAEGGQRISSEKRSAKGTDTIGVPFPMREPQDHPGFTSSQTQTGMGAFDHKNAVKNRRNTAPDLRFGLPNIHFPHALKQTEDPATSNVEDGSMTELDQGYPMLQPCIEEEETAQGSSNDAAVSGTTGNNGGGKSLEIQPEETRVVGDVHVGDVSSRPDESSRNVSPRTRKAVAKDHEPSANRGFEHGNLRDETRRSEDGRPQHVSSPAGDMSAAVDISLLISPDEHYTAPPRNDAVCLATSSSQAGLGTDIDHSQQVQATTPVGPGSERQKLYAGDGNLVEDQLAHEQPRDIKPGHFWSCQKPQRRHTIIPSKPVNKQSKQTGWSRIVSADASRRMTAARIIANIARSHDSCSDDGRSSGDGRSSRTKSFKGATVSGRFYTALADQQPIGQTSYYDRVVSSEAQSQAVLERYADMADLSSDDLRQVKVIFKGLDDTRFKPEKDQPSLPSVVSFDYVKNYTPLGPIEPGMRLLKSVTVSTKTRDSDACSATGSKKWKLPSDTSDHDSGETRYGILNMGWTTHVPTATIDAHRRDDQLSHTLPSSDTYSPQHSGCQTDQMGDSRQKIKLPELANQKKPGKCKSRPLFVWDDESLPHLSTCHKDKHTCEYYRLLKKQMHHHCSGKGRLQLPEVKDGDIQPERKSQFAGRAFFSLRADGASI